MKIKWNKLCMFGSLMAVLYVGCKDDKKEVPEPEEPKPTAAFTYKQVADDDPFTFAFTNQATNFNVVRWEFGDDSSSVETSPEHTFLKTGTFTVMMRAENGQQYWAQRENIIKINPDSLMEMDPHRKGNGTLDIGILTGVNLSEVKWYSGEVATGEPLSTERQINIPVEAGKFENYTLQGKTPKGSVLQITRLLTNLGLVRDATDNGVLSVSRDNDGGPDAGEGSKKLVDGDRNSKFLQFNYAGDLWFQLEFYDPVILGGYTFTSGNDAPERDPLDWRLEASTDGETWDVLDERTGEKFDSRNFTRTFIFENTKAYNLYRMYVTKLNGAGLFQMSEWRVLSLPQD
ncbi:PKD domain-containing protein [Olivibacter ginsenosidimutans]